MRNGEKALSRPFCLNVLYIAVVQRFTEQSHISLLRARKSFLSEFLNLRGDVVNIFQYYFLVIVTLFFKYIAESCAADQVYRIGSQFLTQTGDVYIYSAVGHHDIGPNSLHQLLS